MSPANPTEAVLASATTVEGTSAGTKRVARSRPATSTAAASATRA
jgi:hypothetical protein